MNIDTIQHNLKIVAMLGEQDKLVTTPRFGIRSPTTYRSLLRKWYGENRETDLQNLRSLMSSAICIAKLYSERRDGSEFNNDRLLQSICEALTGMKTLLRTYHDDQEMCARIELLIQESRDQMTTIRPGILECAFASPFARKSPGSTSGTSGLPPAVSAPSPDAYS